MANRLANSTSLYLRQHAENPVDWFEWGDEAFSKAQAEGKPVFLSVGYASCHWCHVMAHESFEDEEAARLLNEHFVSIKIDREERPDVDEAYMAAVQLATQRGGWPMSVFATPDGDPFFAGTYFPRDDQGQHPGFISIVRGIAEGWKASQGEFVEAAKEFGESLRNLTSRTPPQTSSGLHSGLLVGAIGALHHDFDPSFAGFGGAPKFPPHTAIELCLNLATNERMTESDRELALHMAHATLVAMASGGIRDHIGGGFHRYATDQHWGLPHFEKMLSDNALMLANYALAHRVTGFEPYRRVVDEIVGWLEREMRVDGLYASALDADTEGEEGTTYTWPWAEVREVLNEEGVPFMEVYGFSMGGNFEDEATGEPTGRNIPMLEIGEEPLIQSEEFADARRRLLTVRMERKQPLRDGKALVGINGLLVAGFALADHLDLAADLASRLCGFVLDGDTLCVPRYIAEGASHGKGYLEDYAGLAFGLSILAESDPDGDWDGAAREITRAMVDRFWNEGAKAFFSTNEAHELLFGRVRPVFDQPTPSATALALRAMIRHGYTDLARQALFGLAGWMERAPQATEALHTAYCELLALGELGPTEDGVRHWLEWVEFPSLAVLSFSLPPGWHLGSEGLEVSGSGVEIDVGLIEEGDPVRVPVTLAAMGGSAELTVRWQVCSDSACLPWSQRVWRIEP